jgi:3-isopropylmalate/(R)-2-methylmalate dehydratase large subunit
MGNTIVEKVIASHTDGDLLSPGDRVDLTVDRIFCYGRTLPGILNALEKKGNGALCDPLRVVVALDQSISADPDVACAEASCFVRARALGVRDLYSPGRGGVPSVVFLDAGFARPGGLVAVADRHSLSFGAAGAAAFIPGSGDPCAVRCEEDAMAETLRTGTINVCVPATVRVNLEGRTARWVTGQDIGLHLLSLLDGGTIRGRALEIGGEVAAAFSMTDRFELAEILASSDVSHVFMDSDEKTRVHMLACCESDFPLVTTDGDAVYEKTIDVDCGGILPQVMGGWGRSVDLVEAKDQSVHRVVIGGCGGGRIDNLRTVAHFLRDYMVNPAVTLVVIPASQRVFLHAMEEGLIQIIIRAGGQIGVPSCRFGGTAANLALAAGEHCLATGLCPTEFGSCAAGVDPGSADLGGIAGDPGPEGPQKGAGRISFCNPAIAVVAAIMGRIQSPLDLARKVNRMSTGMTR